MSYSHVITCYKNYKKVYMMKDHNKFVKKMFNIFFNFLLRLQAIWSTWETPPPKLPWGKRVDQTWKKKIVFNIFYSKFQCFDVKITFLPDPQIMKAGRENTQNRSFIFRNMESVPLMTWILLVHVHFLLVRKPLSSISKWEIV